MRDSVCTILNMLALTRNSTRVPNILQKLTALSLLFTVNLIMAAHMRSEGNQFIEAIDKTLRIGRLVFSC